MNNENPFSKPDKKIRLSEIFNKLRSTKPASNAVEASNDVTSVFKSVEEKYGIDEKNKMEAYGLDECDKMKYGDGTVYYRNYDKHTIFYGENGSIDVRKHSEENPPTDRILKNNPSFPDKEMQEYFHKPGTDGKGVWDLPI